MKILIVDDNPTNVIIMREILKKENYRDIDTASSARGMFEVLGIEGYASETKPRKHVNIDLILLDMMMPEMDGIEACRLIQRYEHLRNIPIIMVTSVGDSKKLAEALDAGAVDYVMKPINKAEMMVRIRLALRLKQENDWHKERDQRIQDELKLAALVQNAVLSPAIEDGKFEVHAIYQPSAELAGDLYAWYPLGGGRYGVILLDMMGHGISSALLTMFLASVLKDTVTTYVDPEKVIQELNRRFNQLYIENQLVQYYFTAIYLVVDTVVKRIDYVNAGHPPALFFQNNGKVLMLDKACCPVGLFDKMDIEPQTLYYEGEGHIALYTDGLLEMVQEDYEVRVDFLISQLKDSHWDEDKMFKAFFEDHGKQKREDDKCLVWISLVL
ncbi:fused response regulator/phosphatase [Paenibacillus sp. KQZ6P-2]|uniref:Fused response regulator/phosphatase n=1 Tax=Paenibacillus mangrovi TaxID=2931978 RepID=A0A9X1WVV6_9BACL|nr:fused response regulator/phosphatase [Paenibacillus mangrovi]MCJ8014503.1 fused response regulator/phosphatase [Paenibacillus mangrovi]